MTSRWEKRARCFGCVPYQLLGASSGGMTYQIVLFLARMYVPMPLDGSAMVLRFIDFTRFDVMKVGAGVVLASVALQSLCLSRWQEPVAVKQRRVTLGALAWLTACMSLSSFMLRPSEQEKDFLELHVIYWLLLAVSCLIALIQIRKSYSDIKEYWQALEPLGVGLAHV